MLQCSTCDESSFLSCSSTAACSSLESLIFLRYPSAFPSSSLLEEDTASSSLLKWDTWERREGGRGGRDGGGRDGGREGGRKGRRKGQREMGGQGGGVRDRNEIIQRKRSRKGEDGK